MDNASGNEEIKLFIRSIIKFILFIRRSTVYVMKI